MDGLGRLVGDGISSLVSTAVAAIGGALVGIVGALGSVIPSGLLPVVAVIALVGTVWVVARR